MGKPLWGIENKWITREPAYFTRAESEKYPVNNLGLQRLYPSFRTDDYCVLLDGTSNLLYVEDKAGLRATTELSMEFVLKTPGQFERDWLVSKLNYVSGFGLIILVTGQIRFQSELTGNNKVTSDVSMETNSWYRLKVEYNRGNVSFYLNGAEIQTTTDGVMPEVLTTNTADLGFGGYLSVGGSNYWSGGFAYLAMKTSTDGHSGYLRSQDCVGYWPLQANYHDVSGNGNHIHALGPLSFESNTSKQIIGVEFENPTTADLLIIDRRHNLSDGATVRFYSGDWHGQASLLAEKSVIKNKPIVFLLNSPETRAHFWLEINDLQNQNKQIMIPHIFLGDAVQMKRGFLKGNSTRIRSWGSAEPDGCGGINAITRSEKLYQNQVVFRLLPEDRQTIEQVASQWAKNRPVIFCADDEELTNAKLVKNENPLQIDFQHRVGDIYSVELNLQEVGA